MSRRRENRMAAMQFLYMAESNRPDDLNEALRVFFESQPKGRDYLQFGEELAEGACRHMAEVDQAIKRYTENWAFQRIAKVDLAVLRLAIHELLHRRDIPPVVTINEAIEIAKLFSEPESKRFVNGILDQVKNTLDRPLRTAAE